MARGYELGIGQGVFGNSGWLQKHAGAERKLVGRYTIAHLRDLRLLTYDSTGRGALTSRGSEIADALLSETEI